MSKARPQTSQTSPNWVSMTRLGVEFGWSVRKTAQVLLDLGLRDAKGLPTEQGALFSKRCPLPMAPDFFRWHLPTTRAHFHASGYEPLDQAVLCAKLLERFSDHCGSVGNSYFARNSQRETANGRLRIEQLQCKSALRKLTPHNRATVLADLYRKMQADNCRRSEIDGVFQYLGLTAQDVQATLIQASTPVVSVSAARRTL